jgi:hypothetical protein
MRTSPELERTRFDQWITKVLTAGAEDARPPQQVWQRIVDYVVSLDGAEQAAVQDAGEDRSFGVMIGSTR